MNSLFSFARSFVVPNGARGMATLKDLKLRISSTKNIQKITKSMKMIASTRLIKAQKGMQVARKYGNASNAFFKYADTQSPDGDKILYVAVSSDKGLCGGVHSSISRTIRADVFKNNKIELMSLGDKSKAQLSRLFSKNIVSSFSSLGSKPPTFSEASLIASTILSIKPYEKITLFYNAFKSAIAFETTRTDIYTLKNVSDSAKISVYEIEDDVLQNFQEFAAANKLYHAMMEGHAAEVAAKMSAMDNATRNAGDLIGKLTIVYNRTRQAAITTELVDIITGASAL
jgi:F-type H+-transporting ATPase subunit gamma